MKDIFTALDFLEENKPIETWQREFVADRANQKIQKLILSWPVVYYVDKGALIPHWNGDEIPVERRKKSARLAFIEELPKKECEHEPLEWNNSTIDGVYRKDSVLYEFKCKRCGAKLKPTRWEAE